MTEVEFLIQTGLLSFAVDLDAQKWGSKLHIILCRGSHVLMLLPLLFPPQTPMYMSGDALSNVGAAEKVLEYLRQEPSVCTGGMLSPESLHGHVCFQNVSFCYPSRPNIQALKVPCGKLKSSRAALHNTLTAHHC